MNTQQLEHAVQTFLLRYNYPQNIFRGVFPMNHLPANTCISEPFPAAYIVNTDPSMREGSHWLAIYIPSHSDSAEYFDSFGLPPMNENVLRLLETHSLMNTGGNKLFRHNHGRLQSLCSTLCGHYCLFFLFCRIHQKLSFDSFLKQFSLNYTKNDHITQRGVLKHFDILPSLPLPDVMCRQISKALKDVGPPKSI